MPLAKIPPSPELTPSIRTTPLMTIQEVFAAIAVIRTIGQGKHPERIINDKAYKADVDGIRVGRIALKKFLMENNDSQSISDDSMALVKGASLARWRC